MRDAKTQRGAAPKGAKKRESGEIKLTQPTR